jgi:hypothetical protein
MAKLGLDPTLIEDPEAVLPNQIGSTDKELKNEAYAKGLRYSCGRADMAAGTGTGIAVLLFTVLLFYIATYA